MHHVLRFVGGYPLPPNPAGSVTQALGALDGEAIATIELDRFRACFIAEDEAKNVFVPMQHALARRRNIPIM
jgi:hypothetical protein